ncbi:MAG: hypothetical protein CBC48_10170 [bacterium TMED88]|nr:hypothetical protein [Deltaproteobacteria bacterium]OUV30835.1 MAG: hypothetical protein CBC48_10170 [bacterium TMED88]
MSLTLLVMIFLIACGALWIALFLTRPNHYPKVDLSQIDRKALRATGEQLLCEAETWPEELSAPGVSVASSCAPYAVRTVVYRVETDGLFEAAVQYVKNLSDCAAPRREKPDKIEETLYDQGRGEKQHEWIRRSVHVSPPPGSNRDAVVFYVEDRPNEDTYTIAFQSVDQMDGQDIDPHEGASRFHVNPAYFKVERAAPNRVVVRKIEAVDPCGRVSSAVNNYFISLAFFRKYMFDEAKALAAHLSTQNRPSS